MPVYLATSHAYRSWDEGNPKGYVQRDEGLKPTNPGLARWRADHADDEPARFTLEMQRLLHEVVVQIAKEKQVRLHATATTDTHVHKLFSFRSPACIFGGHKVCSPNCPARKHAERIVTRMKQKTGQQLALLANVGSRKWFSRGWDLTPVRDKDHLDYLLESYLPDHEHRQGGLFRRHS